MKPKARISQFKDQRVPERTAVERLKKSPEVTQTRSLTVGLHTDGFRTELGKALKPLQDTGMAVGGSLQAARASTLGFDVAEIDTGLTVSAPFFPEANKTYMAKVEDSKGKLTSVKLTVDSGIAEYMRERGMKLNVPGCGFVRQDGSEQSFAGGLRLGWQTRLENVEVMPSDVALAQLPVFITEATISLRERLADGSIDFRFRALETSSDLNVFSARSYDDIGDVRGADAKGASEAMAPLSLEEKDLAWKTLAPGMKVTGVSAQSIQRAEESIRDVLGVALASRGQRLTAYGAELAQLDTLEAELVKVKALPLRHGLPSALFLERQAKAVADIKAAIAPHDPKAWTAELAMGALSGRRAQIVITKTADIEIIVVPKGKHWASMPQWASRRSEPTPELSLGVTSAVRVEAPDGTQRCKHVVFIPEDRSWVQRHELYHLMERVFLSDDDLKIVSASHVAALIERGPFARAYGVQRDEYFTTWSELFEGRGGPAGVAYLKDNAPEIYGVMSHVTGRKP